MPDTVTFRQRRRADTSSSASERACPKNRKLARSDKDSRGHRQSGTSATVRDSTRLQADVPLLNRDRIFAGPREPRRHLPPREIPVPGVHRPAAHRVERDRDLRKAARDLPQRGFHLRLFQVDEHRLGNQEVRPGAPADCLDPIRIQNRCGERMRRSESEKNARRSSTMSGSSRSYQWTLPLSSRSKRVFNPAPISTTVPSGCRRTKSRTHTSNMALRRNTPPPSAAVRTGGNPNRSSPRSRRPSGLRESAASSGSPGREHRAVPAPSPALVRVGSPVAPQIAGPQYTARRNPSHPLTRLPVLGINAPGVPIFQ